jgi:hypothetical protein
LPPKHHQRKLNCALSKLMQQCPLAQDARCVAEVCREGIKQFHSLTSAARFDRKRLRKIRRNPSTETSKGNSTLGSKNSTAGITGLNYGTGITSKCSMFSELLLIYAT